MERTGVVTMKGRPMTLIGPELKTGQKAPDFIALDKGLAPVSLKDFGNKIKLITVTPSLDTPVCDLQARRFNSEAAKLGDSVEIINISMDLPFAIGRFCSAAGIDRVKTLSDHRDASFGNGYGVLIKEVRLLARAVFVIDAGNTIGYMEIVHEVTSSVNFEKALQAAAGLVGK